MQVKRHGYESELSTPVSVGAPASQGRPPDDRTRPVLSTNNCRLYRRMIMGKALRLLLLVLVLALIGSGWLQWRSFQKKKELRADALLYFKEEDYSKSIDYLEKALDMRSVFSGSIDQDMKCYLAESYYRMDDYEKAEKLYHNLQKTDRDNSLYYLLEGQCVVSSGDPDQAMEIFKKGWEKTGDTALISEICEIYIEQKEYDKALDYAKQVIDSGNDAGADLMYDLIIIYEKSRDYKSAYKAAKEYCDKYPDDEKGKKELIFLSTRI